MGTGLKPIVPEAEFLLALARRGSFLLRRIVGAESVYRDAALGSILFDDAVDLRLGFGGNECSVDGSHEGCEEKRKKGGDERGRL